VRVLYYWSLCSCHIPRWACEGAMPLLTYLLSSVEPHSIGAILSIPAVAGLTLGRAVVPVICGKVAGSLLCEAADPFPLIWRSLGIIKSPSFLFPSKYIYKGHANWWKFQASTLYESRLE
jgi:hypothetical protein